MIRSHHKSSIKLGSVFIRWSKWSDDKTNEPRNFCHFDDCIGRIKDILKVRTFWKLCIINWRRWTSVQKWHFKCTLTWHFAWFWHMWHTFCSSSSSSSSSTSHFKRFLNQFASLHSPKRKDYCIKTSYETMQKELHFIWSNEQKLNSWRSEWLLAICCCFSNCEFIGIMVSFEIYSLFCNVMTTKRPSWYSHRIFHCLTITKPWSTPNYCYSCRNTLVLSAAEKRSHVEVCRGKTKTKPKWKWINALNCWWARMNRQLPVAHIKCKHLHNMKIWHLVCESEAKMFAIYFSFFF